MAQEQKVIEEHAPSVEEAIQAGLARLGLSRDAVDIEVLDEGRRGLLGLGGRDAIVRLSVKIKKPAAEPVAVVEKPVEAPASAPPRPAPVKTAETPAPVKKAPPQPTGEEDEKEAAAAREVVGTLLNKMSVDASIETTLSKPDDLTGRRVVVVNISGDDLGLLIGPRGETMDALQHLARLMVGHKIRQRANFVVDIEGYRERRELALSRLAQRMGKKAVERGRPVTLEPMPAYERRVIHMTLREDPQVRTESTGEGDRRRVRIYPV
jgi:spoIIIJ-associated protein